jgi:hypothetical protein
VLQAARLWALAARLRATRIAAGPDGVAITFEPGTQLTAEDVAALARLGDGIDWDGERLLLSKGALEPDQARDLALELLTELD